MFSSESQKKKKITLMKFEIVIKIVFHLKIYKNNIFYFLKFILISIHQNNQKINKN